MENSIVKKIIDDKVERKLNIVISGTIGVGKSTISAGLVKRISNSRLIKEKTVQSVYFKRYYENLPKWGFVSQLSFLLDRHKDWITTQDENNGVNIYDRHFLDDWIFNVVNVNNNEYSPLDAYTYEYIWTKLTKLEKSSKFIDYFFLLVAPKEVINNRVTKRDRKEETNHENNYFTRLYDLYYKNNTITNHFKKYCKKYILIDCNREPKEIIKSILSHLESEKLDIID